MVKTLTVNKLLEDDPLRLKSLNMTVKKLATDVNGTIIDKNTLPVLMQTKYPFFLFGGYDLNSGYRAGNQILGQADRYTFLCTFIQGVQTSANIVGFTGLNDVQNFMSAGDIVTVYTDSILIPTVYVWIIHSCPDGGLCSLIQNLATTQKDSKYGKLTIKDFNYNVDFENQFKIPMTFVDFNNLSDYRYDNFSPEAFYKSPYTVYLNDILVAYLKRELNQFFGLYSYIIHECNFISFNFRFKHKKF